MKKTVKILVLGTTLVIGVGLAMLLNKYNNKVILLDIDQNIQYNIKCNQEEIKKEYDNKVYRWFNGTLS